MGRCSGVRLKGLPQGHVVGSQDLPYIESIVIFEFSRVSHVVKSHLIIYIYIYIYIYHTWYPCMSQKWSSCTWLRIYVCACVCVYIYIYIYITRLWDEYPLKHCMFDSAISASMYDYQWISKMHRLWPVQISCITHTYTWVCIHINAYSCITQMWYMHACIHKHTYAHACMYAPIEMRIHMQACTSHLPRRRCRSPPSNSTKRSRQNTAYPWVNMLTYARMCDNTPCTHATKYTCNKGTSTIQATARRQSKLRHVDNPSYGTSTIQATARRQSKLRHVGNASDGITASRLVCMYVCLHVCMHMHVCAYMHIYVHKTALVRILQVGRLMHSIYACMYMRAYTHPRM